MLCGISMELGRIKLILCGKVEMMTEFEKLREQGLTITKIEITNAGNGVEVRANFKKSETKSLLDDWNQLNNSLRERFEEGGSYTIKSGQSVILIVEWYG